MCEGGFAAFKRVARDQRIRFAGLWLFLPVVSAYLATLLLKTSLIDARYMLLALPGLFVLLGCFVDLVKCPGRRVWLPLFTACLYLMMTAMPCWRSEGRFSYRIDHDWRSALTVLSRQVQPAEAVLLRSGFIKENWVPSSTNSVVLQYAQAPLRSFYFHSPYFNGVAIPSPGKEESSILSSRPSNCGSARLGTPVESRGELDETNREKRSSNLEHSTPDEASQALGGVNSSRKTVERRRLPVFTLPYSYEKRFAPYMDAVLAKLAETRRVWIIGVNPPNTNYPIERTPLLFKNRRIIFEKSYGGVHLSLLK
jgi:hypothetical protein